MNMAVMQSFPVQAMLWRVQVADSDMQKSHINV